MSSRRCKRWRELERDIRILFASSSIRFNRYTQTKWQCRYL
jgi:hypothetical protein